MSYSNVLYFRFSIPGKLTDRIWKGFYDFYHDIYIYIYIYIFKQFSLAVKRYATLISDVCD